MAGRREEPPWCAMTLDLTFVFLAHGEPDGLNALRDRLIAEGFAPDRALVPALDQGFSLTRAAAQATQQTPRLPAAAVSREDWHNLRARLLLDLDERLEA